MPQVSPGPLEKVSGSGQRMERLRPHAPEWPRPHQEPGHREDRVCGSEVSSAGVLTFVNWSRPSRNAAIETPVRKIKIGITVSVCQCRRTPIRDFQ